MGAQQRRRASRSGGTVAVPLDARLRGRLLRRYKRFFADIETAAGEELTVHCPDPGSMRGCAFPGAAVRCSTSDNPRRKLRHTLEMIRVGRAWVGVHPARANAVAARAIEAGAVPELAGYAECRREVRSDRSRLDFRLAGHPVDRRPAWVEVKSVSLAEGRTALFPDSVTERGRRHLDTLATLVRSGERAVLLYVVQRADCDFVAPADAIDPDYGRALRAAVRAGVETLALGARVTARGIAVERRLPVLL
jgi:sugar fermentation stimulation protein A